MCPLGISMMNNHTYGSIVPKNPFWRPEWGFQAKCAKTSNSYIFRSVYHIDMKFDSQLRPATETPWVVSYGGKTIPRWRTAAILKIVISPYLSEQELSYRQQIARQLRTQYAEGIYGHKYYTVTLKSRLWVTQGHWKWNHWIVYTRLSSSRVI